MLLLDERCVLLRFLDDRFREIVRKVDMKLLYSLHLIWFMVFHFRNSGKKNFGVEFRLRKNGNQRLFIRILDFFYRVFLEAFFRNGTISPGSISNMEVDSWFLGIASSSTGVSSMTIRSENGHFDTQIW